MASKRLSPFLMGVACVSAFLAVKQGEHFANDRLSVSEHRTSLDDSVEDNNWEELLPLRAESRLSPQLRDEPAALSTSNPGQNRSEAIRRSIEAIGQECQRNASGDWDRWESLLKPYQNDLRKKTLALRPAHEGRGVARQGEHGFPLFECEPKLFVRYIYEPQLLSDWYSERSVAAASRWLKQQGIDLIFVPVPKMTEVYPEFFADHCPTDRIVVPRFRRILKDLMQSDVEVLDSLPMLLAERNQNPDLLYQPVEPHWGPRGQAIVAKAIAERMKRYDFVAQAQANPPVYRVSEAPYEQGFDPTSKTPYAAVLSLQQRQRAEKAQPHSYLAVTKPDGSQLQSSPQSPVMVIGDSFNHRMSDVIVKELNLPLRQHYWGSASTGAFPEFLREPSLLKGCKVVVWTVCMTTLAGGNWDMPPPIRASLREPAER